MSYGSSGPPKGYSQPMKNTASEGKRKCQTCNSSEHFTYECTADVAAMATAKAAKPQMSRAQRIRMGIKKTVKPAQPPMTEEESFQKGLKNKVAAYEAELREEFSGAGAEDEEDDQEPHDGVKKEEVLDEEDLVAEDVKAFPAGPVYFVLGGPGSGKGTNCARLVEEFGLSHFSAGDLLRAEAKKDSEMGKKITGILAEGQIVPMEVTIGLLCNAMKETPNSSGYLLDGFPRKMDQALKFEEDVAVATSVLFFDLAEDTMLERIRTRTEETKAAGGETRADDDLEIVKKRFKTNVEQCMPVIEKYRAEGRLKTFDASQSKEQVYAQVKQVIEDVRNDKKDFGRQKRTRDEELDAKVEIKQEADRAPYAAL